MKCKICGNSKKIVEYKVKEMMYGFRDEFLYFECKKCGCLQIAEIPTNMSKYYPNNYHGRVKSNKNKLNITTSLLKKRDKYAVFKKGLLGKLMYDFRPAVNMKILSEIPLTKDSYILDVGCGKGFLLKSLKRIGFNNLLGVDPYIDEAIINNGEVILQKKEIHEVKQMQDLIMFHHSFEHIANPLETLQSVSKILNKNGYCIIRVPTVSSYAWRHYKENWVQLDAPRHFFLHSKESMEILAKKAFLKVDKIIYDSTELQFWGSERYLKDIPLKDTSSNNEVLNKQIFSNAEMNNFKRQARILNQKGDGDACAFILKSQ